MAWPAPIGRTRTRREEGAVALFTALSMVFLMIGAALVLDFALVRVDRQAAKSTADSAVMSGLRAADGGTGEVYTIRGVCSALDFLRSGSEALSGLPVTALCSSSPEASVVTCNPADATTIADYTGSTTHNGATYTVRIKSPYNLSEGSFPEESYATLASDPSRMTGCDQLAVIITASRRSAFGSLATSSDLTTRIRSVGRVHIDPGDDAPAMLLLKRTGCPILSTGSNNGDSTIRLFGDVSSDGRSQPGTIHADTDGSNCTGGSNANTFLGRAANGIVAFAAPMVSNPSQPDLLKPGIITSVAGKLYGQGIGYDDGLNVFGSGAITEAGIPSATKIPPYGRSLVTRRLVDERYLGGVRSAIDTAQSSIFSPSTGVTSANAAARGYTRVTCSGGGVVDPLPPLTELSKLFVDCANTKTIGLILAGTVVFGGVVSPSAAIEMPNATKVYIFGSSSRGLNLGSGTFSMHTTGNMSGSLCTNDFRLSSNKAVLVIKDGDIKQTNGGLLRLCNTTMIVMGGQDDGCLPSTVGTAPTQTPCASGMGTGQLSQTGGNVDWTAPNSIDVTSDLNGISTPAARAAWADPNGPEDLAFWSESAGNASSATYNMNGQGTLHTVGVYMVPNADPFTIGGGASQHLVNAQYIASTIALNGAGTNIAMTVDPHSAVTLPELNPFTLIR